MNLLFVLLFVAFQSYATVDHLQGATEDGHLCQLFPANALSSGLESSQGFATSTSTSKTKKNFEQVVSHAKDRYEAVFKKQNISLKIIAAWETDTVNAFARNIDNQRFIDLYGGLYRMPQFNHDGFLAVLCHELGHHLGGPPMYEGPHVLSAEGQSDYYATNVCLPLMFRGLDNERALQKLTVPFAVTQKCNHIWGIRTENSFICQRSIMAGWNLASALSSISSQGKLTLVKHTTEPAQQYPSTYPDLQCRLDTYVAGALCKNELDGLGKVGDPNNCSFRKVIESKGARPECWLPRN